MEPVTELDPPYSSADAQPTPWSDVRGILEAAEVSWISTVREDGRPHVTPLVAVWLDDAAHFCTGAHEQKAVNLRTNQRVALTTGCNGWATGTDVVIEGEAVRVTEAADLERLAAAWRTKWDGSWQFDVGDGAFRHEAGEALVFRVVPDKVLSFSKADGAASRHRF